MKEKWENGWKVVKKTVITGDFVSCCIYGSSVVTYGYDKITTPKKPFGPLAVFSSKKFAKDFISDMDHLYLKKCKFVRSKRRYLSCDENIRLIGWCPEGTIFAEKVKLVK